MKRKVLLSILVIVGIFTITGCGSSNDTTNSNQLKDTINKVEDKQIIKVTHHCTQVDDDDIEIDFYYENDKMVKMKITYLPWSTVSDGYYDMVDAYKDNNGITVTKGDNTYNYKGTTYFDVIVEIDATTFDGRKYLEDNEMADTSWEKLSSDLEYDGYKCD